MARLLGVLMMALTLAACSSGVSDDGAGGAGTNTGSTDLIATAMLNPDSFSSDAFESDTDDDGEIDQRISTDFATMTITLNDPIGKFSRVFQGATFNLFRIEFLRRGAGPNLGPRDVADVLNIILSDGTGTGSVSLPIVDNVTKQQFRNQASGSTIFVYTVRVRAFGRDFATNTPIVVEARATVEIGDFVEE